MAKREEIPTTDSRQIEQLIERLKQGQLEQGDTQLLERLLRTFLSLLSVLQQKNASIKKLKRMIFGPRSEKRQASSPQTGGPGAPTTPGQAEAPADQSTPTESGGSSSASPPSNQKPKKPRSGARKPPTTPAPMSSACITPLSSLAINAPSAAAGGCAN